MKLIESSAVVYGVAAGKPMNTATPSEPSASIVSAPPEMCSCEERNHPDAGISNTAWPVSSNSVGTIPVR
jgi:hypothetical protein